MRVLLTAFDLYDEWEANSSWLTMVDLLQNLPSSIDLVTRRYPVDLRELTQKLNQDLSNHHDVILHLGQSPGIGYLKLEAVALNAAGRQSEHGRELPELVPDGPVAFRSTLPLGRWSSLLSSANIPAKVSYHAGTFLCNAAMYLSHYHLFQQREQAHIGFIHLPLATEQVVAQNRTLPSLPVDMMSKAVRLLLEDLPNVNDTQHV